MKTVAFILFVGVMTACTITDSGIIIDKPTIPDINICENIANADDIVSMKENIDAQSFKKERLARAKLVTKTYCFVSSQVIEIIESMLFRDSKLEMAKDLYDQSTDKKNYYIVVDALTYASDREELREYMAQNP